MSYKIYIEPQGKPYPYDNRQSSGSLEQDPVISSKMKMVKFFVTRLIKMEIVKLLVT